MRYLMRTLNLTFNHLLNVVWKNILCFKSSFLPSQYVGFYNGKFSKILDLMSAIYGWL